jgi:hypothetical protein
MVSIEFELAFPNGAVIFRTSVIVLASGLTQELI